MATVSEYKTILEKLDGKQSISIPVDIKRNGLHVISPLNIIVKGFLKFKDKIDETDPTELVDKTVVHPVLFSSDTIKVSNGRCVVVFLPRSEDLFEETETIQDRAEEKVTDEEIITQGGILEDEQITDPGKEPVVIKIETGVTRQPYSISLEVTVTSVDNVDTYSQTVDRGISPVVEEFSAAKSLFQKETARVASNLVITSKSDVEWIPSVRSILGDNDSSITTMLEEVNNMKNSTPLGTSTSSDALVAAARLLSNGSVDDKRKTIYFFTDNEANISVASLDEAITEVNDIDGDKQVPVMSGNMAISDNTTLSIKANRSDTKNINKLSFLTGGQAVTVTDEDFLDEIIGIFYRASVGSLGYGIYEFIQDFGEEVLINNITPLFFIPSNDSSATWSISTSLDGYNYTVIDASHSNNDSIDFENLLVRYIRFKIVMVTGISSTFLDEYGTRPDTPFLISIEIIFNANKKAFLFLNREEVDTPLYHVAIGVDANEINSGAISVGLAKSDSHNWTDFFTESQPVLNQNGKIVIPLRFSQNIEQFKQEPLERVDRFVVKTKYGRFDIFDTVILFDKEDKVIESSKYKLDPRQNRITFNFALESDYQTGDFKIGIINSDKYKIGLSLNNKTEAETLDIFGVGYEYSSSKDLLPPVSKSKPEVSQVEISPEAPSRFDLIEASYVYKDSNNTSEETTLRQVRWKINGNPVDYLNDLISWNNINDPGDPLFANTNLTYPTETELAGRTVEDWADSQSTSLIKANDNIRVEIQVSDGVQMSDVGHSSSIKVAESTPVLTGLNIMARDSNNNIIARLDSSTDAVIYPPLEQSFFTGDEGSQNRSEIRWLINGELFKSGIFGDPLPDGTSIEEIRVNEISQTSLDYGLRIGNSVQVSIIPQTSSTVGEITTSLISVVQNALSVISDVGFVGSSFSENNNLNLIFTFSDFEAVTIRDSDLTSQSNTSIIKWYRKNELDSEFTLVYSFNDPSGQQEIFHIEEYRGQISSTVSIESNSSIVSSNILVANQQWYCQVTGNDTIEDGNTVVSKTITITSST